MGKEVEPRKRAPKQKNPVRIYVEAGVTLAVTENPHQYVKFTFGQERIAPNDDQETIDKVERRTYEDCERIVEKRVKKLTKLIRRVNQES